MTPFPENFERTVTPARVQAFLEARRWRLLEHDPRFSVWGPPPGEPGTAVFVPLSSEPADYRARLADVVVSLSEALAEPIEHLMTDLRYATADVIRVRLAGVRIGAGEVPLHEGASLIAGVRDMMVAAACTAVEPRPSYGSRKPGQAQSYLNERVRMGPSEAGSYVVTVISELAPVDQRNMFEDNATAVEVPFERQVTTALTHSLGAAHSAARAVETGEAGYAGFDSAVELGVSANLCDALATMSADDETARIGVGVSWAASPVDVEPFAISFEPAAIPILSKAKEHLRRQGPFQGETVIGQVEQLSRPSEDEGGIIVIAGHVQGRPHMVRVELTREQYDFALTAHGSKRPIRIQGTVFKRGRHWVMVDHGEPRHAD